MSNFKVKWHQIIFHLRFCPIPRWGSPDSLSGFNGSTSKGRGGERREGRSPLYFLSRSTLKGTDNSVPSVVFDVSNCTEERQIEWAVGEIFRIWLLCIAVWRRRTLYHAMRPSRPTKNKSSIHWLLSLCARSRRLRESRNVNIDGCITLCLMYSTRDWRAQPRPDWESTPH